MSDQIQVLYIEDNIMNTDLMERIIENVPGAGLLVARDGATGIAAAREHRPALIMLDHRLPDMTGLDALASLKGDPGTASIPVIVVTGEVVAANPTTYTQAGAVAFLLKPLQVRQVIAMIDEVLARAPG